MFRLQSEDEEPKAREVRGADGPRITSPFIPDGANSFDAKDMKSPPRPDPTAVILQLSKSITQIVVSRHHLSGKSPAS